MGTYKCCKERGRIESVKETPQWEVRCFPLDQNDVVIDRALVITTARTEMMKSYSVVSRVNVGGIHEFRYAISCVLGKFNLTESGKMPFIYGIKNVISPEYMGVGLNAPVYEPMYVGVYSGYCDDAEDKYKSVEGIEIANSNSNGGPFLSRKICPTCFDWFYQKVRDINVRRVLIEGEIDVLLRSRMIKAVGEWVSLEKGCIKRSQEALKTYLTLLDESCFNF